MTTKETSSDLLLFNITLDRRSEREDWQLNFEFRGNNLHDWYAGLNIPMGIDRRSMARALREFADYIEKQ